MGIQADDDDEDEDEDKSNGKNVDQAALLGVALAGAIALVSGEGAFDLWSTFIGLTLLFVLKAYDHAPVSERWNRYAFGAVYALCVILIIGPVIDLLSNYLTSALGPIQNVVNCQAEENAIDWENITALSIWTAITVFIAKRRE